PRVRGWAWSSRRPSWRPTAARSPCAPPPAPEPASPYGCRTSRSRPPPEMARVVALDVGSSSVRAVAYDEHGVAEPGDAHIGCSSLDADELVAAARAVLDRVGEADAVAISCFWHSLLPVDDSLRPLSPVLTWRDLAG